MSNLEHELMATERGLESVKADTGASYVSFMYYEELSQPFSVSIHNGYMVRSEHGKTLALALEAALAKASFDATPKEEKAP